MVLGFYIGVVCVTVYCGKAALRFLLPCLHVISNWHNSTGPTLLSSVLMMPSLFQIANRRVLQTCKAIPTAGQSRNYQLQACR